MTSLGRGASVALTDLEKSYDRVAAVAGSTSARASS